MEWSTSRVSVHLLLSEKSILNSVSGDGSRDDDFVTSGDDDGLSSLKLLGDDGSKSS